LTIDKQVGVGSVTSFG